MAASEKLKDMENQTVNSGFREIEIGKQGLRKWVLQKGNSWKTPVPGDEVEGN